MEVIFDADGLPLCPSCSLSLSCESAGDRDTETMGGLEVEYFVCEQCKQHFELIDGCLYGCIEGLGS